jgi:hypothetical protein
VCVCVRARLWKNRQEHCDIRINLMQVSREHAEIVIEEDDKVCIKNVSKIAETLVNGKAVRHTATHISLSLSLSP